MPVYTTMKKIRSRNPAFFSREARARMGSILESRCYPMGLFITSEQPHDNDGMPIAETKRAFTVRRAMDVRHPTGRKLPAIQNVAGGFAAHATLEEAETARKWYQELLGLTGADLLKNMSAVVGANAGFTAMSSPQGGFTLICGLPEAIQETQTTQREGRDLVVRHFEDTAEARDCLVGNGVSVEWWDTIVLAAQGLPIGAYAYADPKGEA